MKEMEGKKISKTSFLDKNFRKNLESALRFGNPLLVQVPHRIFYTSLHILITCLLQDVEAYDPILNPVLNKEVQRRAGRVLIVLGDTEIDLSPTFEIFLSTRDPTVISIVIHSLTL